MHSVELASRLMLLATAAVAFFLVAAVVDHWFVPGGLSIYGRLAFLAVFLVGGGWFFAREIAPLFVYRINPLFASQTIERAKPTLKNSLLNFLMLRSNRGGRAGSGDTRLRNRRRRTWSGRRSSTSSIARVWCKSAICCWRWWRRFARITCFRPRVRFRPLAA